MSASTVSITANPAGAARRRPVEKKYSNIELLPNNELQLNGAVNKTNGDDKSVKDPILEISSKELIQVKRTSMGANNSTVSPRRSRKTAVTKPEKARWATIVSVLSKNLALLLVLLGLVQMVRMLVLKSGEDSIMTGAQMGLSEFEGRIADIEGLMKTTTNMIQVQVEVVDRKIASEIGGLRREISQKIEDKTVVLERELKELDAKSRGLEKSLSEFDKIFEELKKKGGGGGSSSSSSGESGVKNDVSLDDIRTYAREVVMKEIDKHAADGLGRLDYALASGGGTVVKHSDPYVVGKGASNWFFMTSRNGVHSDSEKMLKPSFGEPGQCFPLKGSRGFVHIRLRTPIVPEAITLEHVAKSVAYDRSSAPKDCRVSGWLQGNDIDVAVDDEKMFLLTEFTYDLEKSNAQTFNVLDSAVSGVVDTVRLDFMSNHGSPSHTCIYRLRVHGHEPDSVSMMAMQS